MIKIIYKRDERIALLNILLFKFHFFLAVDIVEIKCLSLNVLEVHDKLEIFITFFIFAYNRMTSYSAS